MHEHTAQIAPPPKTGALVVLPDGIPEGGVTVWADSVRDAIVSSGGVCEIIRDSHAKTTHERSLCALADRIAASASHMRSRVIEQVVIMPQIAGSTYAASCIASHRLDDPGVSLLGSMHTEIRHDIELIRRFAPCLSGVMCVSNACARALCMQSACRTDLVSVVPSGVPIDPALRYGVGDRQDPLRLLAVGRLDAYQKRVMGLPLIVRGLRAAGVPCCLTIVGEGPARKPLAELAHEVGGIELVGHTPRDRLAAIYASHDLLLMPSRSEGLGLARIEAAAYGCVPVVTPGGAAEWITPGVDGVVVSCPPETDDAETADRFVHAIAALSARSLAPMRTAARDTARERFSPRAFADAFGALLASSRANDAHRRAWRSIASDPERAAAFTVPHDAGRRIASELSRLTGSDVVLHGAGNHTLAVWEGIHRAGVRVVAIADDDPQRWGGVMLGVPVINPAEAARTGASIVLLSSWLHEDAVWMRRSVYEHAGMTVIRLYGPAPSRQFAGR